MMSNLIEVLAQEQKINPVFMKSAIKLMFEEEYTIPFVARYRKEMTGSMDEVQLRNLRDRYIYLVELEEAKEKYLKVVEEHCKNNPSLSAKFLQIKQSFKQCTNKQQLEDLYLPYRPKRKTRGQRAIEQGFEPLLEQILAERDQLNDLELLAIDFLAERQAQAIPAEHEVHNANYNQTPDEMSPIRALNSAAAILAERLHERSDLKGKARKIAYANSYLQAQQRNTRDNRSQERKKRPPVEKYENYFEYREPIQSAASHRVMAVRRGEAEKVLHVSIDMDDDAIQNIYRQDLIDQEPCTESVQNWFEQTIQQAYRRLINPALETEIRIYLKNRAEQEAIQVFSKNLENLLSLPPIPDRVILGVDPGIRTGSKLAVISNTGKLLEYNVVHPNINENESPKSLEAIEVIKKMLLDHKVEYVAIGNGTGSREIDSLIVKMIKESDLKVKRVVVNEAGASVYSTDEIAREEFPDLDPTIRSAVSIARRLQDPLAELVKIDPKSIGVGQYQHDCNNNKLSETLKETVSSCVHKIGVNVNTASYKLLSYVSGIKPSLARNIVAFREKEGPYSSREKMKEVSGFGPKSFELSAGFFRVPGAENPLDNSAVHPENYRLVKDIANDLNKNISDIIGKKEIIDTISLERYVNDLVGMPTLLDIKQELIKPGRDPRSESSRLIYSDEITSIEDLEIGMQLQGIVSNVTKFGAFVDIGVHQDGLVHISELSQNFIKDPAEVVSVGEVVNVVVLQIDNERKRIGLSCKQARRKKEPPRQRPPQANAPRNNRMNKRPVNRRPQPKGKQYSVNDLLDKFNSRP